MFEPALAFKAASISTKGTHSTTLQPAPATSGFISFISAVVSDGVLFIFQLPAITAALFDLSISKNSFYSITQARAAGMATLVLFVLFIVKRGDAGKLLALKKFKRSSAAGGDMGHFIAEAEGVYRRR